MARAQKSVVHLILVGECFHNSRYYDDAACIVRKMFLDEKAPHIYTIPAHLPWRISEPAQPSDAVRNREQGTVGIPTQSEELRCVIAVIRQ